MPDELSPSGLPCCGESFMAGTICSLPPGHNGGHGTSCQDCDGDWYMGTCTCYPRCTYCESVLYDGVCDDADCPGSTPLRLSTPAEVEKYLNE